MKTATLLIIVALTYPLFAGEPAFQEDFENNLKAWDPLTPSSWEIQQEGGNSVLVLTQAGIDRPPVRRPREYALVKGKVWRDATITAKVKTLRPDEVKGRDVCILFGFVDDTHFYYAHVCSESNNKTHNVIMKVSGTERTVIMNETKPEPRLTAAWHTVRVSHASAGDIKVWMDDMDTPLMTANDTSYPAGKMGIGTFDDTAMYDEVTIELTPELSRGSTIPLIDLAAGNRPTARPNIVFIYADDWGWGDLACHGHPEIKTPHIDRLAREGIDFQQFVVCNPVCSPSRTAIVTGHYPARHLVHQHFATHEQNVARGMPDWLDPKVTLLPRILKEAGYATGHFGKWHLSGGGKDIEPPLPVEYGYDDAAVWTGPGRAVFEGTSVADKEGNAGDKNGASFQTIAAAEHVLRFIRSAKDQPFYVNFWTHETHHLVAATEEQKAPYPDTPEPQRTYYAAVTRADAQVGRVLALLDELNLTDNTIVIFSSDNGPENTHPNPGDKFYYSVGDTGGLRGRKRSLYMGGVNVPFIVRWPGHVPAGRTDTTSLIAGVDMLPTLLAAAGIPQPAGYRPDGVNVMAAFQGRAFTRTQPLFWEWRGGAGQSEANWPELAMRDGFHTLVMTQDGQRMELYDLTRDRAQEQNLAPAQPERVAGMVAALKAWKATLPCSPPPVSVPKKKKKGGTPKKTLTTPDLAKTFGRWDTNKDGVLSLQEYHDGLSKPDNYEQRFKNFDKNGDGKVSHDEFVIR